MRSPGSATLLPASVVNMLDAVISFAIRIRWIPLAWRLSLIGKLLHSTYTANGGEVGNMNWKTVAIEELRNYEAVRTSLGALPELIERQETAIRRIRTSDPEKVVGTGGGNNDALLSAIVYRDELKLRLKEARKTVAAIERSLGSLTDDEYLILERIFIHPRKNAIDTICEELCIERSAAYDRRNKALEKFTTTLYGCS